MSILDMIGKTGILPLRHMVPQGSARILLKLEYENPTGSMKDRMAVALRIAEKLGPDHTVVTIACDTGMKYLSTELYSER